jgi:addiction module HigA family antidote
VPGPTPAIHPGEILRMEFLVPLNLSAYAVAKQCKGPRTRIERLAREEVPVTADTALRLGRYFSTGPEFWLNLQIMFDLSQAADAAPDIAEIEPLAA